MMQTFCQWVLVVVLAIKVIASTANDFEVASNEGTEEGLFSFFITTSCAIVWIGLLYAAGAFTHILL
jgi:hypothetical protein